MIKDKKALEEIVEEWNFVQRAQGLIKRNLGAFSASGGVTFHGFKNLTHSLCLLFATSVLEHALKQLKREGHFRCCKTDLAVMMEASRDAVPALPWQNYSRVDQARDKRNGIAHRQEWIERKECWEYISAIETELAAWGILQK